jgi:hypothetical protein
VLTVNQRSIAIKNYALYQFFLIAEFVDGLLVDRYSWPDILSKIHVPWDFRQEIITTGKRRHCAHVSKPNASKARASSRFIVIFLLIGRAGVNQRRREL